MPGDFWMRGMQALVVIALVLAVLAAIERRWTFTLFVVGFFGLSLLSSLYNVSNLFSRFGIGGNWNGNDQGLPNLILPGSYLIIGGAAFWAIGLRTNRALRATRP
jgi:ABC-type dipeptide/oligopeptide/nickel transport system permease component